MPRRSSVPAPCIDAERLAAWSAGTLRGDESTVVEQHLADCVDCQAMLAAFVESAPAATAAAVPFWQRWSVRWLVPVAAAGAAVLVWTVATRDPGGDIPVATTMARAEQAGGPPMEAPAGTGQSAPAILPEPAPPLAESTTERRFADQGSRPAAPAQTGAAGRATEAPQKVENSAPAPRSALAQTVVGGMQEEPAAAPPPSAAGPALPGEGAPVPGAIESGDFRAAARLRSGANNVMMDGISAMDTAVPAHARVSETAAAVFGEPPRPLRMEVDAASARSTSAEAARALPLVRWRILPGGRVERSPDSGQTWSAAAIDPAAAITAGSAAEGGVCWLVGRDGRIWRSADATTFERRPFPESTTLVAVEAQDGSRATVTTGDGRTFVTTDGGSTWARP